MHIVFLDLDGTVNSSSSVRDHLIPKDMSLEENWLPWHEAHVLEKPNTTIIPFIRAMAMSGAFLIVCSMRSNVCHISTSQQLASWGLVPNEFILKGRYDDRCPASYKWESIRGVLVGLKAAGILEDKTERPLITVIDDDPDVCELLMTKRHLGIQVLKLPKFTGE